MKNEKGFSLIELMVVVAIIGVIAAIAFPAYLNYIRATKLTSGRANCVEAQRFTSSELAKKSSGNIATSNVIADLNMGNKRSPYDNSLAAFSNTIGPGVVRISINDLQAALVGSILNIECDWTGDGLTDNTIPIVVE